jgi:hypothetical protein
MPNRVYVRPALPEEVQTYFGWAIENEDKNEFDPAVALFSSSTTWCAYDKDGPLAYQTLQQPIMLESLALRPGLSSAQTACCLRELTQNAITLAHVRGSGEIYFLASDTDTAEFASNHIFEEVPMKIYRTKLADLEGKNVDHPKS